MAGDDDPDVLVVEVAARHGLAPERPGGMVAAHEFRGPPPTRLRAGRPVCSPLSG